MKKFLALAAVMLGLASCQTEPEGFDVNVGGEQDVNITVSLPEGTRADSGLGAFDHVNFDEYDVRFQCEVHYGGQVKVLPVQISDNGKEATFPVRLIANRDYRFVVWADLVNEGNYTENVWSNEDGLHYDTTDLHNITLKKTWVAMDETRDAYTDVETLTYNGNTAINLELTRPFAKLRVVTTDMVELGYLGIEPHNAVATYTTKHYESFNACNGSYAGEVSGIEHTYEIVSYGETGANKTIFADYFFANNEVVKFNLDVKEANGETIKKNTFSTDIYVRRNHLTTIQGNILTDGNNVTINVDPAFDGYTNYNYPEVYTENDLQAVINAAEDNIETVIYLGKDIELTRTLNIPLQKVITLDLNGKQITTTFTEGSTTNHIYAIDNKGTLKIKADKNGEGKITARGIFNYGTMTLESGKINACDHNGGYGVRNNEGSFTMNGGTIVASNENGDDRVAGNYDASPLRVDEGATATINGGNITNISNYTVAIDNYGTTTINGGNITSVHSTVSNSGTMTIKGDATTIKCEGEYTSAHPIYAHGEASVTTIENGNIIGNDKASCYYVAVENNPKVYIYGGEFTNAGQAAFTGEGTIVVTGGQFDKDPSARVVKGYEANEENGVWTVGKPKALADFEAAIAKGGNVTLASDVTLLETITIENEVVIDLDGKTVTAPSISAFTVKTDGKLTLKNGNVVAHASVVSAQGGEVVIESGYYTETGDYYSNPSTLRYCVDARNGGKITINGGEFNTTNGMFNVNSGCQIEVNGGKFTSSINNAATRHFAYVGGQLTITDGEFYGKANSSAGGCFFCGAAAGCNIEVNGGKFTSLWTSGSVNRIFERYVAGGQINVTGGMFNTNGGIATFVTENTDEATKAAYPYVAK
jgi:hypothetical protein